MGNQISREERAQRIDEVYRLLLTCNSRRVIHRYAKLKGWEAAPRTIDEYIACARKDLTSRREESRDEQYAIAQNRLEDLYAQSYKQNDFKTCLQVQKEANDLAGLHTEQIRHTVTITDMDLLRKQVDAAIAEDPLARDRLASALSNEDDERQDE